MDIETIKKKLLNDRTFYATMYGLPYNPILKRDRELYKQFLNLADGTLVKLTLDSRRGPKLFEKTGHIIYTPGSTEPEITWCLTDYGVTWAFTPNEIQVADLNEEQLESWRQAWVKRINEQ